MSTMSPEERLLVLSRGFQTTAEHLDRQFLDPVKINQEQLFGFSVSMIVLRVFAVELALKALIWKVVKQKPEYTHELTKLFEALPDTTTERLDQIFQQIRKMKPSYKGETDSLVDVLAAHENAFVEWRYLEPKAGDLGANVNLLSSVLQALWAEYQLHP